MTVDLCTETFAGLAARMGFSCDETGGLVMVRNPFRLENWTLPVLEITIIVGAVLTLVYAFARWRRTGDATNVAVWFGALAYLFIIEPPLYFPGAFGIDEHVDTMFAHNLFTVDFLWGRLPLYIVAIYPLLATISFETVRMLGVFRRCGTLVGACAVGVVHHALYEIFDHLGPQLRWWEWTLDNPLNQPFFTSVPVGSVVVFAALWPMSLALCAQFFVGRRAAAGETFTGLRLTGRIVAIAVTASIGTFVLPLPATLLGLLGDHVRGVMYFTELAVMTLVGVIGMWRGAVWVGTGAAPAYRNRLVQTYFVFYLVVFAGLWLFSLPDHLSSVGGVTAAGDPVGSLPYVAACFVIAMVCVGATFVVAGRGEPNGSMDRSVRDDPTRAGGELLT